jgi:flagellar biosynthetic protein FliR
MTIAFDPTLVTAFALALVRASCWLFVSPPFNTRLIPIPVKAGVAAVLAMAAAPHVADPTLSLETAPFVGALVAQAVVGFVLGFMTMMLVNAISSAGALIDLFAGYSMAAIYDPMSDAQNSVFGRFYQLIAVTLLFTSNAYLILVNGFFRSFEAVPLSGIANGDIASVLTNTLGQFTVAALEIAGPVMACLFLAEFTLGLLTRAAPSLNVFALAFPLRVGVALVVVGIALPMLGPTIENLVNGAVQPFGG